ncbi:SRPBCC family protein [Streptomyces sp. NPDC047813]|uniref:SRPBCC family protein n=1 Tax=Streptomyces sp. NPDC047813 TaxID=3154608 RepID=UPI003400AF6C
MTSPGGRGASAPAGTRTRELSESILIGASPERVYAAISDVRRVAGWSPECVGVLLLAGRGGPHATFLGFNRNGGRRWFTYCRVTEANAPHEFAYRVSIAGLPLAVWGFRLTEAEGTGRIQVTQYWHDLRQGARGKAADLLGRVFAGTTPAERVRVNRAGMAATLHRLRSALETAPERPVP